MCKSRATSLSGNWKPFFQGLKLKSFLSKAKNLHVNFFGLTILTAKKKNQKHNTGKVTHFPKQRPLPGFFFFFFKMCISNVYSYRDTKFLSFLHKECECCFVSDLVFVTLFLKKHNSGNCCPSAHPTDVWADIWATLTLTAKKSTYLTHKCQLRFVEFKNKEIIRSDTRVYKYTLLVHWHA